MDADDTNSGSGGQARKGRTHFGSVGVIAGAVAGLVRDPDRPAIFDLLFWSILVLNYVFRVVDPLGVGPAPGLAPVTLACAVLVAVWLALPWRPSASRRRKLLSPAFLLAATAVVFLSGYAWGYGFYPLAFANAAFLFGTRRGVAYAFAFLTVVFVGSLMELPGDTFLGPSEERVGVTITRLAFFAVVAIGVGAAVMDARRSRERAEDLLGDLEAAHAELRRYAGRVRELTLSEERARMAREIHDSLGHHLTAVKLQAEAAVKTAEKRPEKALEQMERARDLAAQAFEEVHRSVRALKPPAMGERSGAGALRALVRSFEGTGFDVRFQVRGEERLLPEETELVLYRALQEGLTNAVRHSKARRIDASLSYEDRAVKLTISDDGRGAPKEAGSTGGGFGLPALEERVETLGGTFSAGNAPGGGFVVEIGLPFGHPPRPTSEKP